jgi:hypothetical protein
VVDIWIIQRDATPFKIRIPSHFDPTKLSQLETSFKKNYKKISSTAHLDIYSGKDK